MDYLKEEIAYLMNKSIAKVEAEKGVTYTGERFVRGSDWNLDNASLKFNFFLNFLQENGYDTGTLKHVGLICDYQTEQIDERMRLIPDLGWGYLAGSISLPDPVNLSGYKFQSNGTDNYIDLGFVPDENTDMAFQVKYLDSTGKQISGSEEFGLGSSNGNLISSVNGIESTFDALGAESKSLGLLSSGLAYVDGLENGTEATVTGATLNLYAMAKNASSGVNEHCAAVWERISWYHNGTHHYIDFTEGSGSTVTDNFGNEYTIQGTVSDSQWINYEKARRVLIDTDMETDCDDTLALRLAAWAERKGYIDIVAMVMSNQTEGLQLAKAVDALMTFEGRPNLAIGVYHNATVIEGGSSYNAAVLEYPHTLADDELAEHSLSTYRRSLQAAIDDGVKIDLFTIGTLRALADFMKSLASDGYPSGMDMINLAVNEMFTVGGVYPSGSEFNFDANTQTGLATQYVLENFPKKITFTGAAVGNQILTGGNLKDVYPEIGVDLVRDAYFAHGSEDGRRSWDPMSIYLASLNNPSQVGQSLTQGLNTAGSTGDNTFTPNETGHHFYLTNLKISSGYYREPINDIVARQNWPERDDIGRYSIPRISTIITIPKSEVTQGDPAGTTVAVADIADNEISGVTVEFTEGTNSEGYYSLTGNTVELTGSGAAYLSTGGNKLPNIFLTSNTGAKGYGQVRTVGAGEFADYRTEIGGTSYLTLNQPIELNTGWELGVSVDAGAGDLNILWPSDETVPANTLRLHLRGTTLTCSPEGNYAARLQVNIPTSSNLDIVVSCNNDGSTTLTCNGISVTKTWSSTVTYYIPSMGSESATKLIVNSLTVSGISNYDVYQKGLAEFYFAERGSLNGYKYYNSDDDSGSTFFEGVGITNSDEIQTVP